MSNLLPDTYLIGLISLLFVVAILVGRQLLRVRGDEIKLIKLERNSAEESKDASELYSLASVQIKKRLYPQATSTLKSALKILENEPVEAKAIVENALGFALAAQDNFQAAIIHYKNAIKSKPEYIVAINNLAFAKTRLLKYEEAINLYEQVLRIEPDNKTAKRQLKKINLNNEEKLPTSLDGKGF